MEQHSLATWGMSFFRNPVYPHSFSDPFILKFRGEYWGYSTGFQPDNNVFGILHSKDLVHWAPIGSAMEPIEGGHTCYWAPEVIYDEGSFLMYYSVGNEETMTIRVARADNPEGPFSDLGISLTKEPFAIDAHIFLDDDGSRYLFYATDFLTHDRIGTGTVVDRMLSPFKLERNPQPVTRPHYEWQVYDPKRVSKGGVKWHTVEGPFVLKHKGLYYEMFSGGNWQNLTYGVSYVVSDRIIRSEEWEQHADGTQILPILRTIPGTVVGPGHNSVIRGPDNRQLYCVYHVWQGGERVLAIDRMDWIGEELVVFGPTTSEQRGPTRATIAQEERTLESDEYCAIDLQSMSALIEFWVKLSDGASIQLELAGIAGTVFSHNLCAGNVFKAGVWTRVRLELDCMHCLIQVGENPSLGSSERIMLSGAKKLILIPHDGAVECSAIEITHGWESLFTDNNLCEHGWETEDVSSWHIAKTNELIGESIGTSETILFKHAEDIVNYELTVNLRLMEQSSKAAFYLGTQPDEISLAIEANGMSEIIVVLRKNGQTVRSLPWPETFDLFNYQQLRFIKVGAVLAVAIANMPLLEVSVNNNSLSRIALGVTGSVAFDMVRLTEITGEH